MYVFLFLMITSKILFDTHLVQHALINGLPHARLDFLFILTTSLSLFLPLLPPKGGREAPRLVRRRAPVEEHRQMDPPLERGARGDLRRRSAPHDAQPGPRRLPVHGRRVHVNNELSANCTISQQIQTFLILSVLYLNDLPCLKLQTTRLLLFFSIWPLLTLII